jgi:hypothetical protein
MDSGLVFLCYPIEMEILQWPFHRNDLLNLNLEKTVAQIDEKREGVAAVLTDSTREA